MKRLLTHLRYWAFLSALAMSPAIIAYKGAGWMADPLPMETISPERASVEVLSDPFDDALWVEETSFPEASRFAWPDTEILYAEE